MNNFQNNFGKFVLPPTNLASHIETYGSDFKKVQKEKKNPGNLVDTNLSGGFKIFYESKNFTVDEPHIGWNCRNVRKKKSRILNFRNGTEENKSHAKKNKQKIKDDEIKLGGNHKKLSFYASIESSNSKHKGLGSNTKMGKKRKILLAHYALNKTRTSETRNEPKVEPNRTALNSSFTLAEAKEKAKKKKDILSKYKGCTFLTTQSLTQKVSLNSTTKMSEMKTTISDSGKRHINEILKNHAQKIQVNPVKPPQMKDYTVLEVGGSLPKTPTHAGKDAGKDQPATTNTEKKEPKPEPAKPKSPELEVKKEKPREEENAEEKKKVPGALMKMMQSNELERRFKYNWQDSRLLDPYKPLEEEKSKQDEESDFKRVTYTDRLLLLKTLGKSLEEKKQKATNETKQSKLTISSEKNDAMDSTPKNFSRILDGKPALGSPTLEVTRVENQDLALLKKSRLMLEQEPEYKAKTTRSTELRDLVSQAIKEHKIFCIFDNHTYIVRPVREELLSRGWLEVIPDRRLIPRRRPPPMGPVYERDKSLSERNCNTLEAILAAKENFADEIQEKVSKSTFKISPEKPKAVTVPSGTVAKKSDDSLNETVSQFRIIPPTTEKKKNNLEIREFVAKYQAYLDKEKERENEIKRLKEREKNSKLQKKEKARLQPKISIQKIGPKENSNSATEEKLILAAGSKSFQDIWSSIIKNKNMIIQASAEIEALKGLGEEQANLNLLYDSSKNTQPAIEYKQERDNPKPKSQVSGGSAQRSIFSESEAKTISKIIQSSNARIHFMWLSIKPGIHLKCFNYSPEIINKFQKTTFCTKIGLWSHLNNLQWYAHEVHHPAKSPRMYNTGEADDLQAFFQDFHLTACIGILKWLSETFFEKGLKAVQTKKGKVPLKAFEFAIKQCERYIRFKENEELSLLEEQKVSQDEWNTFLQYFYIITNDNGKIQDSSSAQLMVIYTKSVETLKMMRRYWPEMDIDGRLNIWIMKPYCASCGRGIFMTNNVYYIGQHSKYIVQKYIEKPLLIYNTKFDIRQWFMITKLTPLEIWMYKECYLRFCSQPFALRNLHESVHLSNNSVQRKYISIRDPNLPDQNMWDSKTFQLYLKTIGFPNVWDDIIYPGMKDAIVSTMLASQDTFDGPRKSWFEVYGADFMLSANLLDGPWLIEINENPAMDPSTKVTARLCPQMLRDVIKVVVDKRANKNAQTGQWEMIYRQNYSPSFGSVDLDVRGKKIARVPISNIEPPAVSAFKSKQSCDSKEGGSKFYDLVKSYGATKTGKKSSAGGGLQRS